MPVMEFLERNAREYPNEIALVELNPEEKDTRRTTWKEYELIQPDRFEPYRREITWSVFNEKANRFANMLLGRGIKKGDKVAILMYNCLEWLPIYFGVLKTGAIAVPFNFRYDAGEILYCAELAEVDIIVFGPAFIGRIEANAERLSKGSTWGIAVPLSRRATMSWWRTAPARLLTSRLRTMISAPSISPQGQRAFPRPSCISTGA